MAEDFKPFMPAQPRPFRHVARQAPTESKLYACEEAFA
jgi:hypothetical protein